MQMPVAQQLYSSTRSMPFQEQAASRGGAAYDSSFGSALELDILHWSRAPGAAPVRARRFAPSDLKLDQLRNGPQRSWICLSIWLLSRPGKRYFPVYSS